MNEDEVCHRCGGGGVDPDQSNPTYEQIVTCTPNVCSWCNGSGKEHQEPDWD